MRVAIGADHAGFVLKAQLVEHLDRSGHEVLDVGAHHAGPSDYPDWAAAVGAALQEGRGARGILVCGSGIGACIAANKLAGIRAGVCHEAYSARQGVEHDDMNVLVLGARIIDGARAVELVRTFLASRPSDAARHRRRRRKVADLE